MTETESSQSLSATMQPPPLLTVKDVTKVHRQGEVEVPVLRGLSCVIPERAFVFIVGPSGSGKSTLLYLLGALDAPTTGEISFGSLSLNRMTADERDRYRREEVGFIFQNFNLLSTMSAVDNVLVPSLPQGTSPEKRQEAVELLKRVGLGHRLTHRPGQLSGGEQQRVAIARAILKRPKLVLADEPTGELDSENGRQIFQYLRELQRERGSTVVTVTHDERYFEEGDVILEIRDGRIIPSS
ncbi:MAG: ABC transporter ATP-binding protein [Planctomycetaceae bacterium]